MKYPYAWDDGALASFFGVRGIPHAVLVDPAGEIVWRGHPANLPEATIEKVLEDALATRIWEVPTVHEALRENRYATALAAAEKLGDGSHGPQIVALLRKQVQGKMDAIAHARELGDFLRAQELAERYAQELAGLPEAVTAAEVVTELARNERAQEIIGAQLQLRALAANVETVTTMTEARELLAKLKETREAHAGTIVEKHAAQAIELLEGRMRR